MPAYIPAAKRGDWRTPEAILAPCRQTLGGRITLDPCASRETPYGELIGEVNYFGAMVLAGNQGVMGADGLAKPWFGSVFVNPPFSDNAAWAAKCASEGLRGREVILLIPARVDTRYWHEHVATADAVCFWKGRVRFVGAPSSAPFPVALAYWGNHPLRFHEAFHKHGLVYLEPTIMRWSVPQEATNAYA